MNQTVPDLVQETIESTRPLLCRGLREQSLNRIVAVLGLQVPLSDPRHQEIERHKRIFLYFTRGKGLYVAEEELRRFAKNGLLLVRI